MLRRSLLALVLTFGVSSAFAQAPGQTPPLGGGPGGHVQRPPQQHKETKRERVKKRIRALRAYTLTEELALDDTSSGKLFPVMARYDDEFDKLLVQHADLQRRLDGASELKDPRAIDKVIDEAVANQRAFWDLEDKRLAELRKILTPAQIARLLIVLPALERRIQNQLRNAINRPKKQQRPSLDDDDDDDVEPNEPPRPQPGRPQPRQVAPPAPAGSAQPKPKCDPFSDVHSCR
jgi:hypothetical protein